MAGEKVSNKLAGAELTLTEVEHRNGEAMPVILISKLESRSPAANSGLRGGDIILSVNKRPVSNFKEMEQAVKIESRGLLLNIQRGNRGLFILIR
jgi:serine protease DegQ